MELVYRKRCTELLNGVFSKTHDMLLSHEVVFRSILPLLHTRKELDKSINKITSPDVGKRAKTSSSVSEKRALSDQISSLLQVMIPKLQLMKVDAPDLSACNVLTTQLMEEYKKCDTSSSPVH